VSYLDEAIANPDGTYTIKGGDGDPGTEDGGDWILRDTGHGWEAVHEYDSFGGVLWASAEDAAHAVLGDPVKARRA
jgi:hypothetical protein